MIKNLTNSKIKFPKVIKNQFIKLKNQAKVSQITNSSQSLLPFIKLISLIKKKIT